MPCLSVQQANYPGTVFPLFYGLKPEEDERKPRNGRHWNAPGMFGFSKFSTMYPNIRMIVLDNSGRVAAIKPDPLICFLENCRALSCLWMSNTRLGTTFFNRMAELPSLAKLTHFTLLEPNGATRERIHFEFLSKFNYLRHFCTNMAPANVVLELMDIQQVDSMFIFQFWTSKKSKFSSDGWYSVAIRRLAVPPTIIQQAAYHVNIVRRNVGEPKKELFRRSLPRHEARRLIYEPNLWTEHWQDDQPLYRPL